MSVWIVRHACAGHRGDWDGDDDDRPLDPVGRLQAEALVGVLVGCRPTRLVSSPARRCTETLSPLASHIGLEVATDERLCPGAAADALVQLVDEPAWAGTVACTHGELLEALLGELRHRGAEVPGAPSDDELLLKGAAWEVAPGGARLRLHVPVGLSSCPHHPAP